MTRNSIIDQYGKILPRVQRKLAIERAKPYHLSASSVFREGKISLKNVLKYCTRKDIE